MSNIIGAVKIQTTIDTQLMPILPLKGAIVFPYIVVPLMIQEPQHARMLDEALMRGSKIGLLLQKNPNKTNPGPNDVFLEGTAATILKLLRFPDGTVRFLVQGLNRIKVIRFTSETRYLTAEIEEVEESDTDGVRVEALQRNLLERIRRLVDLAPYLSEEFYVTATNQDALSKLTDFIASNLNLPIEQKQEILAEANVARRTERLLAAINKEAEVLELSQKIQAKAASELGKSQRDYILREQLKAIKKELGAGDDSGEVEEFDKRIKAANMPAHAEQTARKELDRLSHMTPSSAEYTVTRTYLDWLVTLPWSIATKDKLDLKKAKKILDDDHFNLEKVKDRILEYLAVRKLKAEVKGPILCFVGPPGVGKTSLGKSIAAAMGRTFARVSLGGMRDEAEIRGHRRTYIGSMPGRVLQSIKRCGSNNPVIMLDEIDKLGTDFRGDPSSALLEVLDPEQNDSFSDHYLEIPFDLSKVMFITTANWTEPIPPVLRDRMEVINIPGYTDIEKMQIAKRHLLPKQLENHGITVEKLEFEDNALKELIDGYTREAGLRNLEREIASVMRKIARKIASGNNKKITITKKLLEDLLGPRRFTREALIRQSKIGVIPGLAYTAFGGEVLYVEATSMNGEERLNLTGHLGEVMKESAQAALSFIRSNQKELGINENEFENRSFHIHVPSGATPKDGPSAGITLAVALASLLKREAPKKQLALTGEITLRGQLLPIGGLKEKLLAAYRSGITTVVLPEDNRKDTFELPPEIKKTVTLKFFDEMLPVIKYVLNGSSSKKTSSKKNKTRKKNK
ncbi:MAG: endopeptidase La [Candidatus Zixiibacteriota bacterium]